MTGGQGYLSKNTVSPPKNQDVEEKIHQKGEVNVAAIIKILSAVCEIGRSAAVANWLILMDSSGQRTYPNYYGTEKNGCSIFEENKCKTTKSL